jgi:hypothetical protein
VDAVRADHGDGRADADADADAESVPDALAEQHRSGRDGRQRGGTAVGEAEAVQVRGGG